MKPNKRGWEEEAEPEFSGPVAERLPGFCGHFLGVAEQRHGVGRQSKLVGSDYLNHKQGSSDSEAMGEEERNAPQLLKDIKDSKIRKFAQSHGISIYTDAPAGKIQKLPKILEE